MKKQILHSWILATHFFWIRNQAYSNKQGRDAKLQHKSAAADASILMVSEQTKILLLTNRPSLHWLDIRNEQNSILPLIIAEISVICWCL
jgi:hypothetical protein